MAKKTFSKYTVAQDMVNIIRKVAAEQIDKLRPQYRFAVVDSIDRVNLKCNVIYTGETTPVTVSMGSIQPLNVGQTVRIAGMTGDRYIDDVLGEGYGNTSGTVEPGFRISTSTTKPTTTTQDGYPLIWIPTGSVLDPVPSTPTAPAFNTTTYTVTPPSVTGVQYQFYDPTTLTWTNLTSGSATSLSAFTRPWVVHVRAIALPGYVLTSSYEWTSLFMAASDLTLYASDSFAGTAWTRLAPANGVAGRTLDMAQGGGSASPAPSWFCFHGTEPSGYAIDATGTKCVRNTNDPTGLDANHHRAVVPIGQANMAIEVNITAWTPAHARALNFGPGTQNTPNINGVVSVTFSSTTCNIVFATVGGVTGTTIQHKASAVEADMLGTWRVDWVGKYCQLTAPNSAVYGLDYSASTYAFDTYFGIDSSDSNTTKLWQTFDWVKFYR